MAEYISFQPSDFYNTTLYTGNSSTNAITGLGFQPDFVWLQRRNAVSANRQTNVVIGATNNLCTSDNLAQATEGITSFDSDGFTVSGADTNKNYSGATYVSWNMKAGTSSGIAGSPSITPSSYSFNQTPGFSIIAYTGNGTAGATIPHGLGAVPDMVIVKKLSSTSDWFVYHSKIDATAPQDYYLSLNGNASRTNNNGEWYDTAPTSTLVTLGANTTTDTATFIAYCFAEKKGYSAFGTYTGTAHANGPFVYTGFRPSYILIKRSSSGTDNWGLFDNKRLGYNDESSALYPDVTTAEDNSNWLDILSNGFKIRTTHDLVNKSGYGYIYMAFAEFPIVSSNDVPVVAR